MRSAGTNGAPVARRVSGLGRDRRGTALIEFAIVAPVLLAMLLGIVAYGGYFWRAHVLQQVANDAARAAIAGLTAPERQSLAAATAASEFAALANVDAGRTATIVSESDGTLLVAVQYDAGRDMFFGFGLVPMPGRQMRRVAAVRMAGL